MKKIVLSTITALSIGAVTATAMDIVHPHDRIEDKKALTQEELINSIKQMEAQLASMKSKVVIVKKPEKSFDEKSFMDKIHFKGDIRARYESKEYEYSDGSDKKQYLGRYRLRLGLEADLTENLHLEFGMRSGNANPTSGNQTFIQEETKNGVASTKSPRKGISSYFLNSLRVNVAGLSYEFGNSTLKVGRQPYMIYRPIKSQLIWDNDVSLDGINYQYKDSANIFTAGINQTSLAEAASSKDDVNLAYAQYVRKMKLENAKLNLGAGFYYYDGVKGNTSLYTSNKGSSMGNTMVDTAGVQVKEDGTFKYDYHIAEAFAELKYKDVFGKPFAVAAGMAYNTAASSKNFGYDLAAKLGKAKNVGDWQVKYSYTELQEDATLGAHSDSDNFGGGTAASGHAIRTKYKFGKNTYLAGTFFFNDRLASKDSKTDDTSYERVQLDLILKF
ncbi:putative porin [Sulfurimonas sp.]|nr:putative porin [Sulfurimonas sp.]